jgi:methionine aminopeptidase
MILLREEENQKVAECTFEVNEVYAVDVAMTTGEGKPREQDTRTTIFKRNVDKTYNLKMKGSRTFLSEVKNKFPTLPFTIRAFEDERSAKLGVRECVQHELLSAYPVLYERPGDVVVHVKFTLLLLPGGNAKITGINLDSNIYQSSGDNVTPLPESIVTLLNEDLNVKKKKRNKKKNVASGNTEGDDENA